MLVYQETYTCTAGCHKSANCPKALVRDPKLYISRGFRIYIHDDYLHWSCSALRDVLSCLEKRIPVFDVIA